MATALPTALYELHTHTHFSYDATASVDEAFRYARERGVRYLAITEHHVIDSFSAIQEVAASYPDVTWIPSAELTVTASIGSVDLVCLGMPREPPAELRAVLTEYHAWQRACGAAVRAGMAAIGFDYTEAHWHELLRSYRPPAALAIQGWTHVRNGLQRRYFEERGFIAGDDDSRRVLAEARKACPVPPYPNARQVVPAVKASGALVVIAHPHGYFAGGDRERMDHLRAELQLDGVECAHPSVPPEARDLYCAYCAEHGLLSTGGSDCHTPEELEAKFGRHGGPAEWWPAIAARLGLA